MKEVSNEVWEIAQDLYEDADFNINRYGEVESFTVMDFDDYDGYYRDCKKSDYEEAKAYLNELLNDVKYYEGNLELNDNRTLWDIEIPEGTEFNEEEYSFLYDQALEHLEEEIGEEVFGLGRSGRHICVADTFRNLTKLATFKEAQEKWEKWLIDTVISSAKENGEAPIEEGLNKGEKKARCTSCGADIIYTNRDIEHDIDSDYIECPNCHSTFDVEYDAIVPLLNKKTESYEVWQRYFEDDEIAVPEYVQSFDTFEKAQRFADGLNEDPNCEAWVKDLNESKKVTEAEDMEAVEDDIKDAVEKSDSTKQEKDQVKGSIDVLKTDEESAIDGYEEFNKETAKVVDKELADTIDDQMQEIVDDEKEHIEKLDTIKSALGEDKKEELFNNSINLNVDAGDIASGNNLDLGGLGALAGLIASEEEKESDDKLEEAKDTFDKQELQAVSDSIDTALDDLQLTSNGTVGDMEDKVLRDELKGTEQTVDRYISRMKENKEVKTEANEGTIKEQLNTGLLPIVDVDLYSRYSAEMLNGVPEGEEGRLDEMIQEIAPMYIKEAIQEVLPSVEIYATGVYHPREYNFSGDELEFDLVVNKDEYEALKEKALSDDSFANFLKDNYKSYDGFISYMADNIDDFNKQDSWKQLVQVIMFALKDTDLQAIKDDYNDKFMETVWQEFPDVDDDELDENKKEELFNNTLDVNVNANDISSNNTLDLGGLGDLMGMTEAKVIEAKNKEVND